MTIDKSITNLAGFDISHVVRRHGQNMVIIGFDPGDHRGPRIVCQGIGSHGFTEMNCDPAELEIVGQREVRPQEGGGHG